MTQVPPYPGSHGLRPNRGAAILVLGILGLVLCVICGIIAWIMGSSDLREIDAGRMDSSGRGLVVAGRICGIISVALNVLAIGAYVLMVVVLGGLAAAGAGRTP